jgi:hypothetical protein
MQIDVSDAEPSLKENVTDACGFDVYVQGEGVLTVALRFANDGRLVSETYTSSGAFVTYSAPHSGASYRYPWMPRETFTYLGGAKLGGSVIYRMTGMAVNHPGVPPEAGIVQLTGTVVGFSPDGVPFVGFSDEQFEAGFLRGSLLRAPDPTPAICAELAGP